jgi:hypothetical protein
MPPAGGFLGCVADTMYNLWATRGWLVLGTEGEMNGRLPE